jgi:hypothetical protein
MNQNHPYKFIAYGTQKVNIALLIQRFYLLRALLFFYCFYLQSSLTMEFKTHNLTH